MSSLGTTNEDVARDRLTSNLATIAINTESVGVPSDTLVSFGQCSVGGS